MAWLSTRPARWSHALRVAAAVLVAVVAAAVVMVVVVVVVEAAVAAAVTAALVVVVAAAAVVAAVAAATVVVAAAIERNPMHACRACRKGPVRALFFPDQKRKGRDAGNYESVPRRFRGRPANNLSNKVFGKIRRKRATTPICQGITR